MCILCGLTCFITSLFFCKKKIYKNRRCFTIKQELPINRQIKLSSVNVISEEGEKLENYH